MMRYMLIVMALISLTATGLLHADSYPSCSQTHAGRNNRIEMVTKNGDSRMVDSVAGHIVIYAAERYGIKQYVTDADMKTAREQMYKFLKWKFYNPSGVMSEFIANGYQHFDKAYVDEAAASLLGVLSMPGDAPMFVVPDWMVKYIAQSMGGNPNKPAVVTVLRNLGLPTPYQQDYADLILQEIVNKTFETIASVQSLMPRSYDIDNRVVEYAIKTRQAYAGTHAPAGPGGLAGAPRSSAPGGDSTTGSGAENPGSAGPVNTQGELEKRIAGLERRVAALEAGGDVAGSGKGARSVAGSADADQASIGGERGSKAGRASVGACCKEIRNPAITGRLGRIVIEFPANANSATTRVKIGANAADGSVSDAYGSQAHDLMPGTYAVSISGLVVPEVTVRSGHDTHVRVGVLRIKAGPKTRIQTYEPRSDGLLTDAYGPQEIGFPAGSVRVKIAGQVRDIDIPEGSILDF